MNEALEDLVQGIEQLNIDSVGKEELLECVKKVKESESDDVSDNFKALTDLGKVIGRRVQVRSDREELQTCVNTVKGWIVDKALDVLTANIDHQLLDIDSGPPKDFNKLHTCVETVQHYKKEQDAEVRRLTEYKRALERREELLNLYDTSWFYMPLGIDNSARQAYKESVRSVLKKVHPRLNVEDFKMYVEDTAKVTCFQLTTKYQLDERCVTTKEILPLYVLRLPPQILDSTQLMLLEEYYKGRTFPHNEEIVNELPPGHDSLIKALRKWYHDEQEKLEIREWKDPIDLLEHTRDVSRRAQSESTNHDSAEALIKSAFNVTIGRYLVRILSRDNIGRSDDYRINRNDLFIVAIFAALLCLLLRSYEEKFRSRFDIAQRISVWAYEFRSRTV